jgi:hypothetical protein
MLRLGGTSMGDQVQPGGRLSLIDAVADRSEDMASIDDLDVVVQKISPSLAAALFGIGW